MPARLTEQELGRLVLGLKTPNMRGRGYQSLKRRSSDNGGPLPFVQFLGAVLSYAGEFAYPNF